MRALPRFGAHCQRTLSNLLRSQRSSLCAASRRTLPALGKQGTGPRCRNHSRQPLLTMFLKNDREIDCERGSQASGRGRLMGSALEVPSLFGGLDFMRCRLVDFVNRRWGHCSRCWLRTSGAISSGALGLRVAPAYHEIPVL